jgi:pantothenate synthetase
LAQRLTLRTKLKLNAVAVQLPIGLEEALKGVVDIVARKAYVFEGAKGEVVTEVPIPAAMAAAKALAQAGVTDAARLRDAARAVLSAEPALKPQYCEIVDLETMAPVAATSGLRCAIAIACHLGATRLIDNADL